jgi:endo-1,4-beta-mannosidase
LDIAAKNGVYVIATLTDCCCLGASWGKTPETYFPAVSYCDLADTSSLESFKGYIEAVLLRRNSVNGKIYRDDTTILAWDVANEPALQVFTDSELNTWLREVTSYVETLDPNHLITIGIDTGGSLYNSDGPYYQALNVPDLDFFSFHHNLPNYQLASQNLDPIKFRIEKFISMGKPVILEEFGVGSQRILRQDVDKNTLDNWVQAYKDQMDTAFSAGASGVMFWGWGTPDTRTVPLWWSLEDHDTTETEFCTLIKDYQIPAYTSP